MTDLLYNDTDWAAAITLDTSITNINPAGLGVCIAELNSPDQATFLHALADGFHQFGDTIRRQTQMLYIADALTPDDARQVTGFLRELADMLDPDDQEATA